jgi:hypothetical protein
VAATEQAHSSIDSAAQVMDVEILRVPTDVRGRLTGEALAATLEADGREGVFRGRDDRRHHQPRRHRRPRRSGLRLPSAQPLDARRRCLRRRGAGGAIGALEVRRDRARRQPDRRPPQVALRALRLLRVALPQPGAGAGRPYPVRRISRPDPDRRRMEPVRLRDPPQPAAPADCPSGSRWRRTGRPPTAERSRRRWSSPGPPRRRSSGARSWSC